MKKNKRLCPICGIDLDIWEKTQRINLRIGGTAIDHNLIHMAENPPTERNNK